MLLPPQNAYSRFCLNPDIRFVGTRQSFFKLLVSLAMLPKVKYDIGAEIRLSTCTLDVKGVLGSYSKIQPATGILSTRSIDLARSQGCRSNF